MARTRAEREADFRARHGVSSGTYYSMRRNAVARGLDPKDFDKIAAKGDYDAAKTVTRIARDEAQTGKDLADIYLGRKRLPGSQGSDKRKKAMAKLASIWRKAGGKVSQLLGAIGSPRRKAKVARAF